MLSGVQIPRLPAEGGSHQQKEASSACLGLESAWWSTKRLLNKGREGIEASEEP